MTSGEPHQRSDGTDPATAWSPVKRLDPVEVAAAIVAAGGPRLRLVERLAGGEVGAWLVAWPDGHDGVMTWQPRPPAGHPGLDMHRVQRLMGLAATAGTPLPRWEQVVDLGDRGWAILQERAVGVPAEPTVELVDAMVELALARRGMAGEVGSTALHLTSPGPGFCLHAPLQAAGGEARELLHTVQALGRELGDELVGNDVVHCDWHSGNVLVDPSSPSRVTAVVDWSAVRLGRIELDLATLAFDSSWRSPDVARRAEAVLLGIADDTVLRLAWAHMALRLIDWAIRHHPGDLDHWLEVGRRHL